MSSIVVAACCAYFLLLTCRMSMLSPGKWVSHMSTVTCPVFKVQLWRHIFFQHDSEGSPPTDELKYTATLIRCAVTAVCSHHFVCARVYEFMIIYSSYFFHLISYCLSCTVKINNRGTNPPYAVLREARHAPQRKPLSHIVWTKSETTAISSISLSLAQ